MAGAAMIDEVTLKQQYHQNRSVGRGLLRIDEGRELGFAALPQRE